MRLDWYANIPIGPSHNIQANRYAQGNCLPVITVAPLTLETSNNVRTWNRYSQIKTVCRRDAAAGRPGMASLACLDLAIPVSCPQCPV
ncbi:MAG TPA: hypothetical protein ENI65_00265 [Gammaproteobacteria bacterium]|nr:hypothetical protein [Gammaproteobacteria bacterium]